MFAPATAIYTHCPGIIFQLCTQHIQKKIDLDFIEETSDIGLFLFACEDLFYFS